MQYGSSRALHGDPRERGAEAHQAFVKQTLPQGGFIPPEEVKSAEGLPTACFMPLGLGLRKAKESYYPDLMVEKHSAVWKA